MALRALGCDVKKAEVKAMVSEYSRDGSERVDFDAFLAIMTAKYLARDPEAEARKAFALFDEEGSGAISLKALKRVARELGEDIPDAELEAMIEEVRVCVPAPTLHSAAPLPPLNTLPPRCAPPALPLRGSLTRAATALFPRRTFWRFLSRRRNDSRASDKGTNIKQRPPPKNPRDNTFQ